MRCASDVCAVADDCRDKNAPLFCLFTAARNQATKQLLGRIIDAHTRAATATEIPHLSYSPPHGITGSLFEPPPRANSSKMALEASSEVVTREALEQQPFIDNHWLYYNGPLRRENVLEYFSLSKFYDRRSCNEELRMQGAVDIRLEHLEDMRGVQYLAEEVPGTKPEDPVFVIQKVLRTAKAQTQVLDVYYVLQNMIYQAPTIFSVLNARLRRCAAMLNKAQKSLKRAVAYGGFGGGEEGGGGGEEGGEGGGGGGGDMYRVARKGGKATRRARAAAAAAAAAAAGHAEMQPPPPPFYGYPPPHHHPHHQLYPSPHPEGGEPMVMVEGVGDHHHHYPLPPMMMPPPSAPLPHLLIEPCSPSAASSSVQAAALQKQQQQQQQQLLQQQQLQQQEEEPRFTSRYPGSPLAGLLTHHHPEATAAVDRALGTLRMEEVAGGPSGHKDD